MEQQQHMRTAIELARRAWGQTHPNPMVGCVIVRNGKILAQGWHQRSGGPHAEVMALQQLRDAVTEDMSLYVTLEPCSTPGRTGACTDQIIASGIKNVCIGAYDPNPVHAGRGIEILRQAGLHVVDGICSSECEDLNLIFKHWITQKECLIAGKMATTIDGKVASRTGHSKWITGPLAREEAMSWRRLFPAILVGAGTVLVDNPSLTARFPEQAEWCPLRFVLDRRLRSADALQFKLFNDAYVKRTIVVTVDSVDAVKLQLLKERGIQVWQLATSDAIGFVNAFCQRCTEQAIYGVLVEGGPSILKSFFASKSIDYLFAYRAPKILGDAQAKACLSGFSFNDVNQAISLERVKHQVFDDGDQLMRGWVK